MSLQCVAEGVGGSSPQTRIVRNIISFETNWLQTTRQHSWFKINPNFILATNQLLNINNTFIESG